MEVTASRLESKEQLVPELEAVRARLDSAFRRDTAMPGTVKDIPSAGHCAAVAAIIHGLLGGDLLSTVYQSESHWFNRLHLRDGDVDVDLTGDQFGLSPVRMAPSGMLFPDTRRRSPEELNLETRQRAALLASRAGLSYLGC